MIRVRIAPSPTGIPHIGNTRTALFNFLFARHNKGKFIVRIEDTDRARLVPESENAIYEILTWLGLVWDEKYKQSDRIEIYKKHADELLERNLAHKDEGAIRFRMPKAGVTFWDDLIGGKHISFRNETQEDFIIIKSDGFPTYNFANVIDDHLMEISHVIRGEEFISSTPKHIKLYEAFGWKHPNFAHLPIVLGPDKTKLSKRHGAKSILDYRDDGFLKEALINYMAILGWQPKKVKDDIFNLWQMIDLFDLNDINTGSPIFDIRKLEWMNGEYIRQLTINNLQLTIYNFLDKKYPVEIIGKTIPLIQDRIKKLSDYLPLCEFFFKDPEKYEVDFSGKKEMFEKIIDVLEGLEEWNALKVGESLQKTAKGLGIKNSEFFMLLRIAITGKRISPPLNESMEILGKEKIMARLAKFWRSGKD